jgi:hypothetical protein
MKVKVIRCGSPTPRPVVEDRPVGTKISHEPEKEIDRFGDGLEAMVQVRDDEVIRENGQRVAEDKIFASV